MNGIVTGVGNHSAKRQTQREEDLCSCVQPYKWVQKSIPLLMKTDISVSRTPDSCFLLTHVIWALGAEISIKQVLEIV